MNDAEKEVLKFLENQHNWVDCDFETIVNIKGAISIIINQEKVIENQKQEIEELKQDNAKQWEERCRLTFKLQEAEERLSQIELQILEED